ncbi:MAG: 2-oxo-4-hydroxy-4-carboxy-5-ureidoimidazoline decarboxylase [Saprospiraceae bacterium]
MDLNSFNELSREDAKKELLACCSAQKWANLMLENFPFTSEKELVKRAISYWYDDCEVDDYIEAFSHHPEIGDVNSLKEKFASKEQASIADADMKTIEALSKANLVYKSKFGFIFIVCATGKSAGEMLRLLDDRIKNSLEEERSIAMGEQMKITIIRLQKLLPNADWSCLKVSQLTTHVLDTSIGKPGKDISICLQSKESGEWQTIAQGITNSDGRIVDLLPPNRILKPGNYNIAFDTNHYFKSHNINGFYPEVNIQFTIFDETHYHVPLLINPYGYSTYRGS